jgi:CRISPR-associated exonuclease Cas4
MMARDDPKAWWPEMGAPKATLQVTPPRTAPMASDLPVISAGDLEKFGYCPLSWWLSEEEPKPQPVQAPLAVDSAKQLKEGHEKHVEEGEALREIRSEEQVVVESEMYIWRFSAIGTGIALFGFALTAYGLEGWPVALIPMAISLVWILTAVLLFRLGLRYRARARARRDAMKATEGEVVYVGEGTTIDEDPALFSHRLGLVGAPDSVVEREGTFIPVELKTGRAPKGPFFSHVLQVIAYCALVEEKYGKAPPFGIVKYGQAAEFEVEYGEEQKQLLEGMLGKMREALVTEDVHRNHDRPGKCANCSRREGCPERLDRPGAVL